MKKILSIMMIVSILFIQGCGGSQVVKSLSAEQLKAQKVTRTTINEYFSLMEQLVSNQIIAYKADEDRSLRKEILLYEEKYNRAVAEPNSDNAKLLKELSKKIKSATEVTIDTKKQYDDKLISLKKKHSEILIMMDNMVVAQETLNSYIQIEKADEVVGNSVFLALEIDQEKIKKHTDKVNEILAGIKVLQGE